MEQPKTEAGQLAQRPPLSAELERHGHDALWDWFGLSYASWLTLPRSMMHEMPDDWQRRMAELLNEWSATWDSSDMPDPQVTAKAGGKFCRWPDWLLNYRHPDRDAINALRSNVAINLPP